MSATKPEFSGRIVPRGYEMHTTGAVSAANLARYAEHVRWDGLRDPDYGLCRFWQRGVIRAQKLQVYAPVYYGHELLVRMCLSRVGRTSFDLGHTIERVADGTLVAAIVVTVVNLGEGMRPSPLAPGIDALLAEAPPLDVPMPAEEPPASAFIRELDVAPSDHDILQHVNHARYLDYIDDTRWFANEANAYGPERPGYRQSAARFSVVYDQEARFGDRLQVLTWPAQAGGAYEFQVRRQTDNAVLTRARVSLA